MLDQRRNNPFLNHEFVNACVFLAIKNNMEHRTRCFHTILTHSVTQGLCIYPHLPLLLSGSAFQFRRYEDVRSLGNGLPWEKNIELIAKRVHQEEPRFPS